MRAAHRYGAVFLLLLVVPACSGGGSHRPQTVPPPTTTTSTSTTVLSPNVIRVDKRVESEGFVINIGTADPRPGILKIQTDVTNVLPSPQQFNPIFMVEASGKTFEGSAQKTPTISSGATVPVELDVSTDTTFETRAAVLIFGNTSKNQATVPLGSAGKYVGLLDVPVPPPGPMTVGEQVFTFTKAVVSAFQFDGSELDAGTEELLLTLSVANNDTRFSYAVASANFTFMRGAETLNSAVVRQLSANPGGSADGGQVYADIDHYAGGQAITMRVLGSDAQQNAVNQTSTLTMPAVD